MNNPLKCPRCGAEIKPSGRFCLKCGENVSYITKSTYLSPQSSQPSQPSPGSSSPDTSKPSLSASEPASSENSDVGFLEKELAKLNLDEPVKNEALLAKVRQRLNAWADAIPNHGIAHFGDSISIVSFFELKNYLVKLNTDIESRSNLQELNKPYENEPIPETALLKQKIENIWDFPSFKPGNIISEKEQYSIPESFRRQKCVDCNGKGSLLCGHCRMNKTVSCPACEGKKRTRCAACRGTGRINCRTCAGKGEIVLPDAGTRKSKCFDCQGHGFHKCIECDQGYNLCVKCNSTGIIGCPECSGAGSLVCSKCKGKSMMLNFLAFESIFTSISSSDVVTNQTLPKDFNINKILNPDNKVNVVGLNLKKLPPRFSFGKQLHPLIAQHVSQVLAKSFKEVEGNPNKRIINQRIDIDKFSVFRLVYEFSGKQYNAYIFGPALELYMKDNPIKDIQADWLHRAQQAYHSKHIDLALEHIARVLHVDPRDDDALKLIKLIKGNHARSIRLWSLFGGITAGACVIALILFFKHRSLNYVFPCLQVAAVCLTLGYLIGVCIAYITSRRIKIIRVKKRIPFLVSAGAVCALFFIIIGVLRYDPIREMDSEQFIQEFNQALPYGIPAVPWEDDITFLKKLVKKFKPTGIDVSKAEKGLYKLNKLSSQKQIKDNQNNRDSLKKANKAPPKKKPSKSKRKIQAAYDTEMQRYENMVIQKKLTTKNQKISFLNNIINLYTRKGIDTQSAKKELARVEKIKETSKKKKKIKIKTKKKNTSKRKKLSDELLPEEKKKSGAVQ
ncbi:MAG: hypothetical protein ABII23_09115 [bacterium]